MKNGKTEQGKKTEQAKSSVPGDWLYMTPKEVTVREIKDTLDAEGGYEIEIWEEVGVLEIGFGDGDSMDIEAAEIHPKDEVTKAFAAEHGIKSVFLVTFLPDSFSEVKEIMKKIIAAKGGFFCGDTEDFQPMVQ